jgi:hypothetical protein
VEAEGAPGDHTQSVVDSFNDAIGQSVCDVGEDAGAVLADRTSDAHEGLELRARRPREPVVKRAPGALGLAVVERVGESFLQQVRSVERAVVSFDLAQLAACAAGRCAMAVSFSSDSGLRALNRNFRHVGRHYLPSPIDGMASCAARATL